MGTGPSKMRTLDWVLTAVLAVVFAPAFIAMSREWDRIEYYSHGYMIPLVALWAATAQRAVLPTLPVERDPRGIGLIILALLLYLPGMAASIVWLAGISVPVAVAGAVLYLRGEAWLRALSFSIAYLLFMVPLPSAVVTPIIVKLQLGVSTVGVEILRMAGYAVLRDGNVIDLPGGDQLFVAEACSGITSLVTLLPLGVFLAYFTERSLGRRLLLVATVIPIAMLGNLVRVIATVVTATRIGSEAATSSALHDWVGIATYVLACIVLLGVGRMLQRWWPLPEPAPG